ncbi:MAG: response regulator transcription factor [Methanothrix sp.]|nr:response regulator transcription factor [Methanothrix sp.]
MKPKTKLLIVDDETDLIAELVPLMQRSGYAVVAAQDGEQALQMIERERPDIVILDMLLPRLDGRDVLRRLRQQGDWTPVILLTKVNTTTERVLSLQEGADDYLNKPFDPLELVARVQAVLRRTRHGNLSLAGSRRLRSGALLLDRQTRQVAISGHPVSLTARAVGVLEFLMFNPLEVVPRQRLQDEVWGWSSTIETRAVDIRIAEIRKALGDDPEQPQYIETVIGQGYRFLKEVEGSA